MGVKRNCPSRRIEDLSHHISICRTSSPLGRIFRGLLLHRARLCAVFFSKSWCSLKFTVELLVMGETSLKII